MKQETIEQVRGAFEDAHRVFSSVSDVDLIDKAKEMVDNMTKIHPGEEEHVKDFIRLMVGLEQYNRKHNEVESFYELLSVEG